MKDLNHGDEGRRAIRAGEWDTAAASFRAELALQPAGEAYEGLGMTGFLASDERMAFDGFEGAYQFHREAGDGRSAARMAMMLASASWEFRGETAVASGWLRRAERLLEGMEPAGEHAWLDIYMANFALMVDNDVARAEALTANAAAVARRVGDLDAEMMALSLRGLALVIRGEIAQGMAFLDEAATAALAGDVDDPNAAYSAFCNLIEACSRVFDFERAAQWCQRAEEYTTGRNLRGWYAICRPNYARVLLWRGDWSGAETELLEAARVIQEVRPPFVVESLVRLGELRVRQGRFEEAAELFARTETDPLSLPGRAWLAWERGDGLAATDLAERFRRSRPAEDISACALVWEVTIRAAAANGDLGAARAAAADIAVTAAAVQTAPVRAAALHAEALVAAAEGNVDAARKLLEDACDLYGRAGAVAETARARLDLASLLAELGRAAAARAAAEAALAAFQRLGARPDATRAERLLKGLGVDPQSAQFPSSSEGFTAREREILEMMARGFSNQQLGERLVISIRTVERHVSNIYQKLGVSGPAARAAAVAHALGAEFDE